MKEDFRSLEQISYNLSIKLKANYLLKGKGGNNRYIPGSVFKEVITKYIWFHIKESLYLKVFFKRDIINNKNIYKIFLHDTKNKALYKDYILAVITYNNLNKIINIDSRIYDKNRINSYMSAHTANKFPVFLKRLEKSEYDNFFEACAYFINNFNPTSILFYKLNKFINMLLEKTNGKIENENLKIPLSRDTDNSPYLNLKLYKQKEKILLDLYINSDYTNKKFLSKTVNINSIKQLMEEIKNYIGFYDYQYLKLLLKR